MTVNQKNQAISDTKKAIEIGKKFIRDCLTAYPDGNMPAGIGAMYESMKKFIEAREVELETLLP